MATVYEQLYTNATVLVTDFIKSTQQNDVANLYAGVDPTRLNWLEQAWMQWYQYIGNTTVATGIMSFVLHEVGPLPLRIHRTTLFLFQRERVLTLWARRCSTLDGVCHGCSSTTWAGSSSTSCKTCASPRLLD